MGKPVEKLYEASATVYWAGLGICTIFPGPRQVFTARTGLSTA
jgi:hypothetical protein